MYYFLLSHMQTRRKSASNCISNSAWKANRYQGLAGIILAWVFKSISTWPRRHMAARGPMGILPTSVHKNNHMVDTSS